MQRFKLVGFMAIFSVFIILGCKKGDTGPAGANGKPGSANVKYSAWTTLNLTFNSTDSAYEQTITADSLTQQVLDSGVILTYIKFTNQTTNQSEILNAETYMQEIYSIGKIQLLSNVDFSGLSFRYIIIPGGVSAGKINLGTQNYTKQQLKTMPYDQAIKLLGSPQ